MAERRTVRLLAAAVLTAGLLVLAPGAPAQADGNESAPSTRAFRSITGGGSHTCTIGYEGGVRCWGDNYAGVLGQGDTQDRGNDPGEMGDAIPTVDLGPGQWPWSPRRTATSLAAGLIHTCAVLDTGQVRCWGNNAQGQLGIGTTDDRGDNPDEMGDALPTVDLGPGRTALVIAAGARHTCAILDNGLIKCWGYNASGQLGIGTTDDRGDAPGEMGSALPTVDLGGGMTASALTAGDLHTCALLDDLTIKCWAAARSASSGSAARRTAATRRARWAPTSRR